MPYVTSDVRISLQASYSLRGYLRALAQRKMAPYCTMEIYYDLLWFILGSTVLELVKHSPRKENFLCLTNSPLKCHHILLGKIQYNYKNITLNFRSSEDMRRLTSFHLLDQQKKLQCLLYSRKLLTNLVFAWTFIFQVKTTW